VENPVEKLLKSG